MRRLAEAARIASRWESEASYRTGAVDQLLGEAELLTDTAPALAAELRVVDRLTERVRNDYRSALDGNRRGEIDSLLETADRFDGLRPLVSELRQDLARARAAESRARLEERISIALRRSSPHRMLEELEGLPEAEKRGLEQQIDALRTRLAELDRRAPSLEVDELSDLEFRPGEDLELRLRAEDDYEVVAVDLFVRSSGGREYAAVPVRFAGGRVYIAEIPRIVHLDRAIQIYGVARDRSGHEGLLGSARSPVKLKPRR